MTNRTHVAYLKMCKRRIIIFSFLIFFVLFSLGAPSSVFSFGVNARIPGSSSGGGGTPTPQDTTPPTISDIAISGITVSGATITWTTNELSSSMVDYGTTSLYGLTASGAGPTISHSVALTGFSSGALYHFRVRSADGSGNTASSNDQTFTTLSPADTTAPIISDITASDITTANANITWLTNELSSTTVDYGTTASYGSTTTGTGATTTHRVSLSSLTASTTYHFRVHSADSAGNEAFSLDRTFTTISPPDTTPPALSAISAIEITGTSARITWTTNESSNSEVNYGTTTGYETGSVSSSTLVTGHSLSLAGLSSQTEYHFRVRSSDAASNATTSGDSTFTTLDVTPPVISNLLVSDVTRSSARITWTTNEPTTVRATYILAGDSPQITDVGTLATSHVITLSGLAGNSLYSVTVVARDNATNESSASTSFTTLRDTTPPANVSDLSATTGNAQINLAWTNPPDIDFAGVRIQRSITGFPSTQFDGNRVFDGSATSFLNTGLTNGTRYYYTAFAYDSSGNVASGALADGTPSTPPRGEEPPPEPVPEPGPTPEPGPAPGPTPISESEPTPSPGPGGITPRPEPTPIPVSEERRISFDDISFFTARRTIVLAPRDRTIRLLPASSLGITFNSAITTKLIGAATLDVGGSSYLMRKDERGFYATDITAPRELGVIPSVITIDYVNATRDEISFNLVIESYGRIIVETEGEKVGLENAEVTLYELGVSGAWQVWDATVFNQMNPTRTNEKGEYGFLAPRGTYYLEVKHDGFRDHRTGRFVLDSIIINSVLELYVPPKKLADVIEEGAPLVTNVVNVAKNIGERTTFATQVATEEVVQFAQNPIVEETTRTVVAPTITTIAAVNTVAAVSAVNIWNYFYYVFTQPFIFLRRRKRFSWGIVYNAYTRVPVDLAIVRLYQIISQAIPTNPIGPVGPISFINVVSATTPPSPLQPHVAPPTANLPSPSRLVQTRVTDKEGRFVFLVEPGSYRVEVAKQKFIFPTVYLKDAKEDDPYTNVYHGEVIESRESTELTPSIPLDPAEEVLSSKKILLRKVLKGVQYALSIAGVALSVVSFVIAPSKLTGGFLLGHIFLYLLFRRLARVKKPKGWGIVYDESTKKPIKNAVARIFETQYNKLLGTQITDSRGRYGFLGGKNTYYITFEKSGYVTKKSDAIDFINKKQPEIIAVDIGLNQKGADN